MYLINKGYFDVTFLFSLFKIFFFHQKKTDENQDEFLQRRHELVEEISKAIDELANLRTLKQLEENNLKVKEANNELEKKAKVQIVFSSQDTSVQG